MPNQSSLEEIVESSKKINKIIEFTIKNDQQNKFGKNISNFRRRKNRASLIELVMKREPLYDKNLEVRKKIESLKQLLIQLMFERLGDGNSEEDRGCLD